VIFHNTSIWFSYLLFSLSLSILSKFLDFSAFWVPVSLKLSSMVGLLNERARKLISVCTSAWHLGKRFSKVTLSIRRHERNGEISWSLIGHKKYNASEFVPESEARTQMGSWTSPFKVVAQGFSRPSCKLSPVLSVSLTPTICPWVSKDAFF